jgi:hypothetical protein
MEYLRIRYLRANGFHAAVFDSYVLLLDPVNRSDSVSWTASEAIRALLKQGFRRVSKQGDGTNYDPDELISPGAIMSITLCDERGYSKHDLEEQSKKKR